LLLWALGAFVEKPPLPRLVANMTGDFYGDDPEFEGRVATAYPSAVPLAALTKDLSDQGFTVEGNTAVFFENFFSCRSEWAISWQVQGENAIHIYGSYTLACL
jgi:hypothetical protein